MTAPLPTSPALDRALAVLAAREADGSLGLRGPWGTNAEADLPAIRRESRSQDASGFTISEEE